VKVYQVLLIYQYLLLSGYQVLLQQSLARGLPNFRIFWKCFRTTTQPNPGKSKNFDPIQPNPWVDPTHEQLCDILRVSHGKSETQQTLIGLNVPPNTL